MPGSMSYAPAENPLAIRLLSVARSKFVQAISLGLLLLGIGLAIVRIQKQYDELGGAYDNRQVGMFDFHNGVYQPALGLRNGVIPYSKELPQRFQVTRPTPAYSPFIVALHIPLTFLPLQAAEVVYFAAILGMMLAVAWLVLREADREAARYLVVPLLTFMVFSRGGHSTLITGYFTMELVLGVVVAFRYADSRPWLSALGVLFASGKPTYAIPLGIVMLARGNYRALFMGIVLAVVGALVPLLFLAEQHGWEKIIEAVQTGQEDHLDDTTEFPINTWTRIDIAAIVCKWLGANPRELVLLVAMLPLIAWPAMQLRRLQRDGDRSGATTPSGAVCVLAMLTSLYHHAYDALTVVGPVVGLMIGRHAGYRNFGVFARIALAALLSAPLWNYTSSETFIDRLPELTMAKEIFSSTNTLCLVVGMVWLLRSIGKK